MSEYSMADVKLSIDKYFKDNISGVSIDFEGLPIGTLETRRWIQPRILDASTVYHRQSKPSGSSYAETVNILLHTNCFARKGGATNTYDHYNLRDMVASIFPIGQDITIKNYTSSGTTVDSLRVRSIVTDGPMPETNKFLQYAFAVEMDYTRHTTKP